MAGGGSQGGSVITESSKWHGVQLSGDWRGEMGSVAMCPFQVSVHEITESLVVMNSMPLRLCEGDA